MLRGVNVGGNSLKMEWLRNACEEIGLRDVRTYVQSGNIVFTSRLSAPKLAKTLKATEVIHSDGFPGVFGGGTTALKVGAEYWIGTFRGDRVAIMH